MTNIRTGHLKCFPKKLVEYYFKNHFQKLCQLHRNFSYFVPHPNKIRILEIGFGEGNFMRYCGKNNIIGIDMWRPGVKAMKKEGFEAHYADVTKGLPFKNSQFDLVYCEQVIEHISAGKQFVVEIHRVTRKGGTLILRTMDFERCFKGFYADYTHTKPYTKTSLFKILEDSGFDVKKIGNGFFPASFLLRRMGNIIVMLPRPVQQMYIEYICPFFSHEMYAIAVKR